MIAVIGAGLVGSAVVQDLSRDYEIAVFDKSKKALAGTDAKHKYHGDALEHRQVLQKSELVVTTLPGSVSYRFVRKLLQMGMNVVDTSFMEEDPFMLEDIARRKRVLFVPDAGYAPGITNVLAGRLYSREKVDTLEIIVAGLPLNAKPPFRHAVTFNVEGLIDEYTRPARIVRNGKEVAVDPLEDITTLSFGDKGEFDAFYSDGLRTLLRTLKVKEMYEKTLRYPGHLQAMKLLRDFGFFSSTPLGETVPKKLTESLFSSFGSEFRDMCLTRVTGSNGSTFEYTNVDRYNAKTGTKSMARMTGYAAASMARVLLSGLVDSRGVYPPEYFGFFDRQYSLFMSLLRKKGIAFDYTEHRPPV